MFESKCLKEYRLFLTCNNLTFSILKMVALNMKMLEMTASILVCHVVIITDFSTFL